MPNTTQVGACRMVAITGSHRKVTAVLCTQALAASRLCALSAFHWSPIGVTTHVPPPARLLVASTTAATMAIRRNQTPIKRSRRSMAQLHVLLGYPQHYISHRAITFKPVLLQDCVTCRARNI